MVTIAVGERTAGFRLQSSVLAGDPVAVAPYRLSIYDQVMAIQSFRCAETRRLFERLRVTCFVNIEGPARRKLIYLDAARDLSDLRIPPGNRLEALRGDRSGQHSIRINDQWRVCFVWSAEGPTEVEIVDYH
jgi:proteic killer suppression protein